MDNLSEKDIWVFLSHSNNDYEKVRKVRNMLEEQEMRPIMFFLKCLSDDDEISDLIKREIDCRTRFILCDSENAKRSKWVNKEIEYIKNQRKPYEVIDLTKPDDEILSQLTEVRRKSKLYIAYSRQNQKIASRIYERLSRYDYNVFIDYQELTTGSNFASHINEQIESTAQKGYIIGLLSDDDFGATSQLVLHEIELARRYDERHYKNKSSIIPIIIGNKVPDIYSNLQYIQFAKDTVDLSDNIVNSILNRILTPGEMITYWRNFNQEVNEKYHEEVLQLGKLYYNHAVALDNANIASGTICLGLCYEEGIGVDKDLQKAYNLYSDPVATDGLAREMALRVYHKLQSYKENSVR